MWTYWKTGLETKTQTFTCLHLNVLCLPKRTESAEEIQDASTRFMLINMEVHMEKLILSTSTPNVHFFFFNKADVKSEEILLSKSLRSRTCSKTFGPKSYSVQRPSKHPAKLEPLESQFWKAKCGFNFETRKKLSEQFKSHQWYL